MVTEMVGGTLTDYKARAAGDDEELKPLLCQQCEGSGRYVKKNPDGTFDEHICTCATGMRIRELMNAKKPREREPGEEG